MKLSYHSLLFCALLLSSGCEPKDVTPGLWLSGELVSTQVTDWAFTDEIEEIFIETQPWYLIPHSTTIWCAHLDGKLYIGSYGEKPKAWETNVSREPGAKVRIDGKLYSVKITRITHNALTKSLTDAYYEKYDMQAVFGDEPPSWWFYLVEQV